MTFSDAVAQQREQHEKALKRFVTYSLAGSFVLHGVGLCLKVNDLWQPRPVESEEIVIVTAEPPEENLAEVLPPENNSSELDMESGFEASGSGLEGAGAATIVETPASQASASESSEAESAAEKEPEPTSVPIAEDVEPVTEESNLEEPVEEELAEATESRDLSDLLEELRRAREQARQTAANGHSPDGQAGIGPLGNSGSNSSGNGLGGNSTAAVGTGGLGSGLGDGRETGTGSGDGRGTGDDARPQRGSQSREISCRGCDFDYPESADGAEGIAQVIVETDEQGRVVSVMLSRSSGNAALDRAALEQARQRIRLSNARAGESYPINVDFVQSNSEAAQRVRERGDRRSITVSDPEPEADAAPETPPLNTTETLTAPVSREPQPEPSTLPPPSTPEAESSAPEPESSTSAEAESSTPEPESSTSPEVESSAPEPESSVSREPEQNSSPTPIPKPPRAIETAPAPIPELPSAPPIRSEPASSPVPVPVEP